MATRVGAHGGSRGHVPDSSRERAPLNRGMARAVGDDGSQAHGSDRSRRHALSETGRSRTAVTLPGLGRSDSKQRVDRTPPDQAGDEWKEAKELEHRSERA